MAVSIEIYVPIIYFLYTIYSRVYVQLKKNIEYRIIFIFIVITIIISLLEIITW